MHIASVGIGLGKSTFHLVALGEPSCLWKTSYERETLPWPIRRIGCPRSSALRRVPEHTLWGPHYENKVTKCCSSPPSS